MRTCFYILSGLLLSLAAAANDTTKILFIGNSFVYFNNMPQMLKAFADSAHQPVHIEQHTPGGISVGDLSQGSQAHAYNPVVYALIRSKPWDVVVIQDNQGRFVRDSAQFPPVTSSRVVEGHIKLMDSVKANNSCAKVVLFGGWAFKNGSPPYGNTGIEMIRRILINYVFLNDSMNEVIAPIGEAWIKAINSQTVDLWDTDEAHPSFSGSYLTASVIFSTIFNQQAQPLAYDAGLSSTLAQSLRACGDSAVFGAAFHSRYNLGGIKRVVPQSNNGVLQVPGTFAAYTWFKGDSLVGQSATFSVTASGTYSVFLEESDGCRIKSCKVAAAPAPVYTGLPVNKSNAGISVFPNPSHCGQVIVKDRALAGIDAVDVYPMSGAKKEIPLQKKGDEWQQPASRLLYLIPAYR